MLRARSSPADLIVAIGGGIATLLVAYISVSSGAEFSVGAAAAIALFIGTVGAFVVYPHVAVSATVVLFALVPILKVFVAGEIGVVKDAVVLAAVAAATIVFLFERRRVDRWVLIPVVLLLGLYVINVGSGHGVPWAQGVRLTGEPLLLLLVGLVLPNPRRTFRWALASLIGTACLVAAYGVIQQLVGKWTLVDWGYSFGGQVRSLGNGQLRSFGTLDDPFAYAAFLLFGLAAVFFWLRRGPLAWGAGSLLLVGIALSFSRTAGLVLIAFIGLALWRRGHPFPALMIVMAIALTSALILINAGGTQSSAVAVTGGPSGTAGSANVVLNGRISAWKAALGDDPSQWMLGRGVGEIGTAAARSAYTLTQSSSSPSTTQEQAVDSGYLATVADVGFVGLLVLIALFARLSMAAVAAARRGLSEGWMGLALLAALLLDALTRASFTGFPTAFLGLLLVGIAAASAAAEDASRADESSGRKI